MKDGKLPSSDGAIYSGQEIVVPLLERCLKWCDIVQEKYDAWDDPGNALTLLGMARSTSDSKKPMTN